MSGKSGSSRSKNRAAVWHTGRGAGCNALGLTRGTACVPELAPANVDCGVSIYRVPVSVDDKMSSEASSPAAPRSWWGPINGSVLGKLGWVRNGCHSGTNARNLFSNNTAYVVASVLANRFRALVVGASDCGGCHGGVT